VPALSVEWLTVLVYASLTACALLLLAVLALGLRLARLRRTYAQVLDNVPHGDLLAVVSRHVQSVRVRTVGFTRYDAFPDIGGQLSFSTALLDEAGDGVVLTTINGRTNSRSYAKAIRGGVSSHQLSDDERAAIAMAMGRPDQQAVRSHA
jgi:hypothetical protein